MSARARASRENHEATPDTLGAVLYASGRTAPPETEWVQLVQSIAAGDQLALHALYGRAHRPVFTLALRITSSRRTAEELTVDVFHDIWRSASTYEPAAGTVLGWVLNRTRWRAIDRLRFESRQKRLQRQDQDCGQWTAPRDSEDAIALRQQADVLRKALTVLTPDEHQAIETAYFLGLTYGEAAERLNQPLGTVKTRIRSGLAKLRAALAEGEQW
jgi:RNA polymerase sigma-70 factor, ECF subfamily